MIVGTAGHIDHGKTTLVRALTGIDADRLPEEKRRGITLDLGYAWMPGPDDERIGFVDVPGHERLVHTMIAGATGFDLALLVVAADDGPMPQTREHLATLSLLGLHRAIVAITKSERVDANRLAAVTRQTAGLLAGSPLAGAPLVAVSALRGDGITELRAMLLDAAREVPSECDGEAAFRLAVDRCFTLDGAGTVVTGTIHAGTVRANDELVVLPSGRPVRVRSLHAWDRPAALARPGQRCALGLAGVARNEVSRGDWIAAPPAHLTTQRIDVVLTVWRDEPGPLRSGTRAHAHFGATSRACTVALLDGNTVAPGSIGRAQLVLHESTAAWHGDRVVLRDASARRTIAGGVVLDPLAPARHRRGPHRARELDALTLADPRRRAEALLAVAPNGLDWTLFSAAQGRSMPLVAGTLSVADGSATLAIGAGPADACRATIVATLARFHADHPDEPGPDTGRLRRLALPRLAVPLYRALLAQLRDAHRIVLDGARAWLPDHAVALTGSDQLVLARVAPQLLAAGRNGAWTRDLVDAAGQSEALLRAALARLARCGELHQIARDLWYLPATVTELARLAREVAAAHDGALRAAAYRDACGIGRNRVVTILEHFDRIGLLRRAGPLHRLRADCGLFRQDTDRAR